LGGGSSGPAPTAAGAWYLVSSSLPWPSGGPHHRDLGPDAVQADGAVRPQALDLPLAFQLHAELGEERDGGVQVVDDDTDVVHPLNGHVRQHTDAASRQPGAEGTGGSVGLTVTPTDSVTLSDAYDAGERARTRRYGRRPWLVETLSLPRRLGCSVPHLGGFAGNSDAAWSGGVHIVVR
jgi:hypothetical protein